MKLSATLFSKRLIALLTKRIYHASLYNNVTDLCKSLQRKAYHGMESGRPLSSMSQILAKPTMWPRLVLAMCVSPSIPTLQSPSAFLDIRWYPCTLLPFAKLLARFPCRSSDLQQRRTYLKLPSRWMNVFRPNSESEISA